MARTSKKSEKNGEQGEQKKAALETEDDLDALFKLPLAEFTAARNALAAQLKKAGRANEAERVKAVVKPSISAWVVNQLYWRHRDAFDRLITAGEGFRQAYASQLAGKAVDMQKPIAARSEALSGLSRLAGALLSATGHNTAPDTMRRITATLEAVSINSSLSDAPRPGRLTGDVDPPGFESLAALMPGVSRADRRERPDNSTGVVAFRPAASAALSKHEEGRQAGIASAKADLQAAAAILKTVTARANEKEKARREAEELFKNASAAAEEARRRLRSATAEAENAASALEAAERGVEKARKEVVRREMR